MTVAISTTERLTGRTVNGEPTYIKLVKYAGTLAAGANNIAHGITGLGRLVVFHASSVQASGGTWLPIPYAYPSSNYYVEGKINATNLVLGVGSAYTGGAALSDPWAILEYTKT